MERWRASLISLAALLAIGSILGANRGCNATRHEHHHHVNHHHHSRHLTASRAFEALSPRTLSRHAHREAQQATNPIRLRSLRTRGADEESMALSRLHVLESFDSVLNKFVSLDTERQRAGENEAIDSGDSQRLCQLELPFQPPADEAPLSCLSLPEWSSEIPPYILNLYRQIASDSRSISDAVHLMPYKSLVMRSFRQPSLIARATRDRRKEASGGSEPIEGSIGRQAADLSLLEPNLVVELSLLESDEAQKSGLKWPAEGKNYPSVGELNRQPQKKRNALSQVLGSQTEYESQWEESEDRRVEREAIRVARDGQPSSSTYLGLEEPQNSRVPGKACDLNERLLPVEDRTKLCYWFPLSQTLSARINGSSKLERLVEAELHLFKLNPREFRFQSPPSAGIWPPKSTGDMTGSRSSIKAAQEFGHEWRLKTLDSNDSSSFQAVKAHELRPQMGDGRIEMSSRHLSGLSSSLYQLKTNLLEVSLYQVLPAKGNRKVKRFSPNDEFPLRLLDIRRIDLQSRGWETFYVKRAVEDWIQDPSSNLGLLIKAKSMFDEPIPIGLISFADLYDRARFQRDPSRPNQALVNLDGRDISQQPTLMIYTTKA